MNKHRIGLILRKEWWEMRLQKGLLAGMVFLPLFLFLVPVGAIVGVRFSPLEELDDLRPMLDLAVTDPAFEGLSDYELAQALMGQPLSAILLLLPVILPSLIASYSIVGEKTNRTLEPLLATPVTTAELLLAKILASLVPAVAITWLFGVLFAIAMRWATLSERVFAAIISPAWLLLLLVGAPLLAMSSIAATVAVSSRVSDPRSAQQIAAVVVVPLVLLIGAQFLGLVRFGLAVAIAAVLVLALLTAGVTWLAVRLFGRETILTRWT